MSDEVEQSCTPLKRQPLSWEKAFLTVLSETGNVTKAAESAGVARNTPYMLAKVHADFQEAWDSALEVACDALEAEARRRAYEGVKRKKFDKGEPVIDPETGQQYIEYEYSDTMLIFLMKACRPDKYRERYDHKHEVTGKGGGPIKHEHSVSIDEFRKLPLGERIRICREKMVAPARN